MKFRIAVRVIIEVEDAEDEQAARIMAFNRVTTDAECCISGFEISGVQGLDEKAAESQQAALGIGGKQ